MMRLWICLLTAAVLLCACASPPQPIEYHDDRDEKPGPGLFTGDRGGYTVYGESSDRRSDQQAEEEETTTETSPTN